MPQKKIVFENLKLKFENLVKINRIQRHAREKDRIQIDKNTQGHLAVELVVMETRSQDMRQSANVVTKFR